MASAALPAPRGRGAEDVKPLRARPSATSKAMAVPAAIHSGATPVVACFDLSPPAAAA